MISIKIREEILRRLKATEKEHNVHILLAIESGSRAWGFESPDSDYDVRFIYAHPKDWYVAVDLEDRRDVIELLVKNKADASVVNKNKRTALQLAKSRGYNEIAKILAEN